MRAEKLIAVWQGPTHALYAGVTEDKKIVWTGTGEGSDYNSLEGCVNRFHKNWSFYENICDFGISWQKIYNQFKAPDWVAADWNVQIGEGVYHIQEGSSIFGDRQTHTNCLWDSEYENNWE
jgi:hypothetical protein